MNDAKDKQSVLLVEDDSGLASLIQSHLPRTKWSLAVAKSSEEALDLLRGASAPYVFAILDVWLPKDRQELAQPYVGYQLAEQIAAASPETKIIGMSQFIDASSALRTSGRFFGFIEKPALIADPRGVLERSLQAGGAVVSQQGGSSTTEDAQPVPTRGLPWVLIAFVSGLSAAALPMVFVFISSGLLRTCLVTGLIAFLFVLLMNPRRRYFSAFTGILGVWASSTVMPTLGVHIDSAEFLVTFFNQGPEAAFHLSSVLLMVVLLILDCRIIGDRPQFIYDCIPGFRGHDTQF